MKLFVIIVFILINSSLRAQLTSFESCVSRSVTMNFYLYTPKLVEDSYPLVVFLHGGGESGDRIELVKNHGFPKLISQGKEYPFYMFAPQNPHGIGFWDDWLIDQMVDDLVDSLNIDTSRIYLVGLSRGGYGVWQLALNHPEKYAAMISICAASIPVIYVNRLSEMPVWLFHGGKDDVVPVEQSIDAYERMKPNNPLVKLTIYPEANHDSWSETFENDDVIAWLLSQGRK